MPMEKNSVYVNSRSKMFLLLGGIGLTALNVNEFHAFRYIKQYVCLCVFES